MHKSHLAELRLCQHVNSAFSFIEIERVFAYHLKEETGWNSPQPPLLKRGGVVMTKKKMSGTENYNLIFCPQR